MNDSFTDVQRVPAGRFSGCLPRDDKVGQYASIFEERVPIIPRAEWMDVYEQHEPKLSTLSVYQYDQNGEGTCTANAGSQSHCYTFAKTFGTRYVLPLAPFTRRAASSPLNTRFQPPPYLPGIFFDSRVC